MEYILTQDDNGLWYIIPEDKKVEWFKFCRSLVYGDSEAPQWAYKVGRCPSLVKFKEYTIIG